MNPYSGSNFLTFFWRLLQREGAVATDELQLLVLGCVAISSALVGSFLMLRRMTMLANSISHTILVGIVIAYLIVGSVDGWSLLLAALITGLATTYLTDLLYRRARLQKDASTGLVFSALFALGIILVTLYTRSSHIGLEVVMGNADALHPSDLKLASWVLGANLLLFLLFYKEMVITTFDGGLARSMGVSPTLMNYLLMVLVSATTVSAFRAVGVIMALAFLVVPAMTARLWCNRLAPMILVAAVIGCLAVLFGVATARHMLTLYGAALSTGGLVVCWLLILFLLTLIVRRVKLFSKSNFGDLPTKPQEGG